MKNAKLVMSFVCSKRSGLRFILVCFESIAAMKECNLKGRYKTKDAAKCAAIQGQLRSDEVADMKKNRSANNLHL